MTPSGSSDGAPVPRPGANDEEALYQAAGLNYPPRQSLFTHASELALVVGLPPALVDRALPFVTVFNGSSGVDAKIAAPEVLAALPDKPSDQPKDALGANAGAAGRRGRCDGQACGRCDGREKHMLPDRGNDQLPQWPPYPVGSRDRDGRQGRAVPRAVLAGRCRAPRRHPATQGFVMAMISEFKQLFGDWIAAVTDAVESVAGRVVRSRRILLDEGEDGVFTARMTPSKSRPALPDVSFRLDGGRTNPPLPADWTCRLSRQPRRGAIAVRSCDGLPARLSRSGRRFPRRHDPRPGRSADALDRQ